MERILRGAVIALLTVACVAAGLQIDGTGRPIASAPGGNEGVPGAMVPTGLETRGDGATAVTGGAGGEASAVATAPGGAAGARDGAAGPTSRRASLDPALKRELAVAKPGALITVFVHGSKRTSASAAARAAGLRVFETYDAIDVAVARGPAPAIRKLAGVTGLTYLEADAPLRYFTNSSHEATRGNEARAGFTAVYDEPQPPKPGPKKQVCTTRRVKGKRVRQCRIESGPPIPQPPIRRTLTSAPVDGTGVSIAIVDSGIDANHPMFMKDGVSKVARNYKFVHTPCFVVACEDPQKGAEDRLFVPMTEADTASTGGHGTHVAGIAAGYDARTATGQQVHGAAPGATLIGLGAGETPLTLRFANGALNWILEHHANPCGDGSCPPIKVVNNSYGGSGEFNPNSATAKFQRLLAEAGVVTVWAAGNGDTTNDGGDGSDNRVSPQATNPLPGVIAVANAHDGDTGDRDNLLDSSSSRGEKGRHSTYPDITAPGSSILSACMPTLAVCRGADARDPYYGTIGGTSMAAPHIAGIVAQMFQANPKLTAAQVEDALEDTAHPFAFGGSYEPDTLNDGMTSFDKGHGMVDAVGAVARARLFHVFPAKATCAPDGPFGTDVAGDATDVASAESTRLPSEPALDLTSARAEWAGGVLRFLLTVKDLPDRPLVLGSDGESFNVFFHHAGTAVRVNANRPASGAPSFTMTGGPRLTGAFDPASDTITIDVPAGAVTAAGIELPALEDGTPLVGLYVWSRRVAGAAAPVADRLYGACPYTLAAGAVAPARYVTTGPDPAPKPQYTPGASEASVGPGESHTWEAGPFVHAGVVSSVDGVVFDCHGGIRVGDDCDVRFVELRVPSAGAKLTVRVTPSSPDADFDLYVYGPDGKQVGYSAGLPIVDDPDGVEQVTVDVSVAGVYRIEVNPFTATAQTYRGEVLLS
ncbi:MAG TPA: S8 family serine peptidase [Acidimicrobiales bacterium]|nr:S8 family serine peptidase [Acidimicrobiales bacterium]